MYSVGDAQSFADGRTESLADVTFVIGLFATLLTRLLNSSIFFILFDRLAMYVHYAFLFNFFLHAYKITHDQKLFCVEDFVLQTSYFHEHNILSTTSVLILIS